jgi:hypothetical protein
MNYFTSQPLGFEKEAIINVPFPLTAPGSANLLTCEVELSGIKGIQQVSFGSNTPVEDNNDNWTTSVLITQRKKQISMRSISYRQ